MQSLPGMEDLAGHGEGRRGRVRRGRGRGRAGHCGGWFIMYYSSGLEVGRLRLIGHTNYRDDLASKLASWFARSIPAIYASCHCS